MMNYKEFKEQINALTIGANLIGEVMHMPDEKRDNFEERATSTYNFLVKIGCVDCGLASMAIIVRLMALETVLDDPQVKGLIITNPKPEIVYLHYNILRAAGEEPVEEGSHGETIFVVENFKTRLLQLSGAEGSCLTH